jgi:hypothetical protein
VTKAQDALRESTKHATIEQTRAAKAEDKRATVQKALALTQQKFAGQAQTYGKTTAGSLDRIKESVNLLEVRLGKALTPAIRDGANALSKFILQIQTGDGRAGRFAKAIQDLIERLRPLEPLLKALAKGLGILFDAFTLQIKVIARIEGALVSLYRVIVDKVLGAFSSMLDGISAAAKAASHIPIIGAKFKGVADAAHTPPTRSTASATSCASLTGSRRPSRSTFRSISRTRPRAAAAASGASTDRPRRSTGPGRAVPASMRLRPAVASPGTRAQSAGRWRARRALGRPPSPWTTYTGYDTPGHRPTYGQFLTGARDSEQGGGWRHKRWF